MEGPPPLIPLSPGRRVLHIPTGLARGHQLQVVVPFVSPEEADAVWGWVVASVDLPARPRKCLRAMSWILVAVVLTVARTER